MERLLKMSDESREKEKNREIGKRKNGQNMEKRKQKPSATS